MGVERRKVGAGPWLTVQTDEGGGGDLPDWWTVDNTPGNERLTIDETGSIEFGAGLLVLESGRVSIDGTGKTGSLFEAFVEETGVSDYAFRLFNEGGSLFTVESNGKVTISLPDATNTILEVSTRGAGAGIEVSGELIPTKPTFQVFGSLNNPGQPLLRLNDTEDGNDILEVGPKGEVTISPSSTIAHGLKVIRPDGANGDPPFMIEEESTVGQFYVDAVDGGLWHRPWADPVGNGASLWLQEYAAGGQTAPFIRVQNDANVSLFNLGPTGAVTISPSDNVIPLTLNAPAAGDALKVLDTDDNVIALLENSGMLRLTPQGGSSALRAEGTVVVVDDLSAELFRVDSSGATTITPGNLDAVALKVFSAGQGTDDMVQFARFSQPSQLLLRVPQNGGLYLYDDWVDGDTLNVADTLVVQFGSKIGFFGVTPITKPTGVGVTAGDVHAALVSLGLIAA